MAESRVAVMRPNWVRTTMHLSPDGVGESTSRESEDLLARGSRGGLIMPVAIWAAGLLYSAYYIGEQLHVFEIIDALLNDWAAGRLAIAPGKAAAALDRLLRRRPRRSSPDVRARLYQQVFQLGTGAPAGSTGRSFAADWDHLMRKAAACCWQRSRGEDEAAQRSRVHMIQATRDLQDDLSLALTGSVYLRTAEVATLLRDALELLRSPEIARLFGVQAGDLAAIIERAAPALPAGAQTVPTARILVLAESGCRILQDWVATYDARLSVEDRLPALLASAREWNAAWAEITIEGGGSGRVS